MKHLSLAFIACITLAGCQNIGTSITETKPISQRQDMLEGQLDNGMKYIIIENQKPKDRVSLQLVVNAGSLDEADDQQGIAHLVEHMAFNGTKDFPSNDIIKNQEALGMVFGRDVNAMTEYYTTSYYLHLPNNSDKMMNEGFHMLSQQVSALTFDSEELEKERPVVEEEWRSGRHMMGRISTGNREILLANSRFGEREPIGKMDLVRNVDAERIKAFWQDWYHPNNMTLLVVGATNKQQVETMLNRYFAPLAAKKLPARNDLTVPLVNTLSLDKIADKEIITEVLSFNFIEREAVPTTEEELRIGLVNELTVAVFNKRLREQYKLEGENISKLVAMSRPLATGYRNNRLMAILTSTNYLAATKETFMQMSRFAEHGFSQGDLDFAVDSLNSRFQQMADGQRDSNNRRILGGVFNRFRLQAPITDADEYAVLVAKTLKTITLAELEAHMKTWVTTLKPKVIAQIKASNTAKLPNVQEVEQLWQQALLNPPAEVPAITVTTTLMPTLPTPGKVVDYVVRNNIHIWTLSNGSQVWFQKSDDTPNQLMLRYQGWGGSQHLPEEQRRAAQQTRVISKFGYGGFNTDQLNILNASKPNRIMSFVGESNHGIIGSTNTESFESWMQNFYLTLTAPNNDPELWQSTKKLLSRAIEARMANVDGKFNNEIDSIRYANNPMRLNMTVTELDSLTSEDLLQAWKTLFGDAKDSQFIVVGNVEPEQVIALATRYIGSLPANKAMEKISLPRFGEGKHKVYVEAGQEPMAVTSLLFNSRESYSLTTANEAYLVSRIISNRLREELREAAGGVYSVRFGIRMDRLRDQAYGLISYSHDPKRTKELKSLAQNVLEIAQEQGLTQAELDEVIAQTRTSLTVDNISDRKRIVWLKDAAMYGDSLTVFEDELVWLDNVKLSQVNTLMRRILATDNWIDALLVPENVTTDNAAVEKIAETNTN